MADEQYDVRINGDYNGYIQSTGQAATATDQFTTSLGRLAVGLGAIAQKANQRLTLFSAGEAATIVGLTAAAARYDQQTSQLQAHQVMVNASTDAYKTSLNGVRTEMGLTAADSIALMTQLSRLSVPFSQQQAQAKEYVRLAAVTGDSVTGLAQSQTMFMRQIDPTQGGKNVERYSSAVAKMNAEMGASAQGTLDFANTIAPLSQSMGMSAQQILGISGSFSKAGQDGYAAGTVYTKVLSDVNRAIQYGSPEIKVYSDLLGTTVDQFKAMPKAEVITEIFEALNKEGPQAIKTLDRLGLDGVRSQRAISAVLNQGGLRQGINTAEAGFGDQSAIDKYRAASEKALSGTSDNVAKIGESFKTFGQDLGSVFLPAANRATSAIVTLLKPLNELGNFLTQLPTWAKYLGTLAAGFGVLAPLLPRIALGLAGASLLPTVTRGSLGQGFLQGLRPDARMSAAQQEFTQGGGSKGYRGLYRAGMFVGDRLNFGGRNGSLSDIAFKSPDGENMDVRSGHEYTRALIERMGLIAPGVAEERAAKVNERNGRTMAGPVTRGINRTTGFLGDLARSQLRPWNPGYYDNSAADSVKNPETALGNPETFKGFRAMFSKEGFENNAKQIKEHSSALRLAAADARENTILSRRDFRDTHSVVSNLVRETGSLTGATLKAGAGVGYAGLRAGASVAGKGLGSLVGLAGGPAGLALMGGMALGGAIWQGHETRKEARTDDGVDNSAGSDYRNALGLAAKATQSFADMVNASSTDLNTSVSTVQQAISVTADDIKKASGRTDQIVDSNLKTMSLAQATTYAGAVLPGADPKEAQALKYDLIARFGGQTAGSVLQRAQDGTAGNLFGLLDDKSQNIGRTGVYNDLFANKQTLASGQMIADTAKAALGRASVNEGSAGVGRMQQSLINQFIQQQYTSGKNGASTRLNDPTNATRYGALSQALGLDATDKASQAALQKVLNNLQGQNLRPDQVQGAIQQQLDAGLSNTRIGALRADAQQMGGAYTGTGYMTADAKANPFGMLGGTLDTLRGTALGRRLTSTDNAGIAAQRFQGALNNEGDADQQSLAARSALDDSLRANKGNFEAVNAELVAFKSSAGAASSQASTLADAMLAAAQQERAYSNTMGGRTTLTDRMQTSVSDFGTAQDNYAKNPNAPGAYQRVEDTRKAAEATNAEATQRLNDLAQQYRQFDIQKKQGEEQLAYSEQRTREEYYRQANYSEADFARQRSRNVYQFALQQSRAQSDFNLQRSRAESDYQRNRRRQEQDFNHQLVLMAEASAKSVYDAYTRVTVQRTWSADNLLQNMADQQKKIDEQNANLAKARKMGLSNQTISQLGLNDSANAQQLSRLVGDFSQDPRLVKQYNDAAKKRQKSAGDLTKDPANTQYVEMVRQQKLATQRADDDFERSMARQRKDFNTSVGRMRKDFATQMANAAEDFGIMRDRQRKQMEIGFQNQRKDFARQMRISEQNISTFAEDISLSFEQAYKITHARTTGETRKQITAMGNLLDRYQTMVVGKNNDVKDAVKGIYSEFGGTWYKTLTTKQVVKSTSANLGYDIGSHHDGGPTADVGEHQVAGLVHGGEHVATKREVDATPGGHHTWETIRRAVREGNTQFISELPGYAGGGAVANPDAKVSVNGHALSKIAAMQIALAQTISGIHMSVMQGGFGGSHIKASGTSHNWPGVADVSPGSVASEKALRQVGFAAWARNIPHRVQVGSGAHVHAVSLIDPGNKGQGQISSWNGGGDGYGGKDSAPHYSWIPNLLERLGATNLSVLSSAGGMGGPVAPLVQLVDFSKIKAVQAHSKALGDMGMFGIGGLNAGTLPAVMTYRFISQAIAKYGQYAFQGGGGLGGGSASTGGSSGTTGIWRALISAGFSPAQSAGIMGNMQDESGFSPTIVQGGGHSNNPSSTRGGYGLVQWTPGSKLASYLGNRPPTVANEVDVIKAQLQGKGKYPEKHAGDMLARAKTPEEAAKNFLLYYERSAAMAYKHRAQNARQIYNSFNGRSFANGSEAIPQGWGITGENGPELVYFGTGSKVRNNTQTMHAVLQSKAAQVVTPKASSTVNNNTYDHSTNMEVAKVEVHAADLRSFQADLDRKARLSALTTTTPRRTAP